MPRCAYCWDRAKKRCPRCGYLGDNPPTQKWLSQHKFLEGLFKKLVQFKQRTTFCKSLDLQIATKFGKWRSDLLLSYDANMNVREIYGPNDAEELVPMATKKKHVLM